VSKPPKGFRVGDRVRHSDGSEHYIIEVEPYGSFTYGIGAKRGDGSWWHEHDEFTLIRPATARSERFAYSILNFETHEEL
jgi:hypothetical protein